MSDESTREVYLDYHATTPVDEQVFEAMEQYFTAEFGNPASETNHLHGREANQAIETARQQVADAFGAKRKEAIIFTSGATESDNFAIRGMAEYAKNNDIGTHIVTGETEHEAVIEPCRKLEQDGFEVTYLSVDEHGRIDPEAVDEAIRDDTFLVSIMAANNEIGTLGPIEAIGEITADYDELWFHTDAVQAVGYMDIDTREMGIDLMSISGHKIYGPKGIGALYTKLPDTKQHLEPLILGGGHESGKRSGTPNVPAIVGLGKAVELAEQHREERTAHVRQLRDDLWGSLSSEIDDLVLNGPPVTGDRLPNNLNVSFPGVDNTDLVRRRLNPEVMAAMGAACSNTEIEESHVLTAISDDPDRIETAVRFGLGKELSQEDIDFAAEHIIDHVTAVQSIFN